MTADRPYPSEPAGPFPEPPLSITDDEGGRITIERIEPGDEALLEGLIDMYDSFAPADRAQGIPPIGRDGIAEWLDLILPEGPDLIARVEGEILGHATLVPDGNDAYELAIFVHQDYRGQGIGSGLLRSLLGAAATAGIEQVWLTVERWNSVAIRLYESVGFERTDDGSFELEMAIRLAPQTASTG